MGPVARPLQELGLEERDVSWACPNFYQTHQLVNDSADFCATIQVRHACAHTMASPADAVWDLYCAAKQNGETSLSFKILAVDWQRFRWLRPLGKALEGMQCAFLQAQAIRQPCVWQ